MKKVIFGLAMILAGVGFVACSHNDEPKQHDDAGKKTDGKSDDDAHGNSDERNREDNWCDATFNQHCEGSKVVWCNVENAEVTYLDCNDLEGKSCQEARDINLADCVAGCTGANDNSKACSDPTGTDKTAILATAECLETVAGGKALFVTKRETCSSCVDLTCVIAQADQGSDAVAGDKCVVGLFKERCQDNALVYCEGDEDNALVKVLNCEQKQCITLGSRNLATCADPATEGCVLDTVRHGCVPLYNNMAATYTCVTDTITGKNYEQVSTMLCNSGCDEKTGECAADEAWN